MDPPFGGARLVRGGRSTLDRCGVETPEANDPREKSGCVREFPGDMESERSSGSWALRAAAMPTSTFTRDNQPAGNPAGPDLTSAQEIGANLKMWETENKLQ